MTMIIAAMPAHNEEGTIAKVVLGAKKQHVDKVVVVDDGSTDSTAELAEALGALVVRHEENRGYGAAIRTCFETAKELNADSMVILDSDGQHDPSYIPDFINALKTNKADIVIGSRFLTKNKLSPIPKYRIVGMKVLNLFTRVVGNIKISDSTSLINPSKSSLLITTSPFSSFNFMMSIIFSLTSYSLNLYINLLLIYLSNQALSQLCHR
ncbi:Polyprenol monophosphomannose synthase [subsurface metagenome]|nr:glycosyltransferase [Methanosarcinales archaeon]